MEKKYKISSDLYKEKYINNAISDYNEVCNIDYKGWFLVISWDSAGDIEEIFNEFMNYVIWLINE